MPIRRNILLLLAGSGGWLCGGPLLAQTTIVPDDNQLQPSGYPREVTQPEDADTNLKQGGEPDFPYSRTINDNSGKGDNAGIPSRGYYSDSFSGRLEPKFGNARLSVPTDLLEFGTHFNGPLRPGIAPTNADLSLGPFYMDFLSLSSSTLYSDNVNRINSDRKGGFLNAEDLDMLGIVQFTDRLRLSFEAGLIYFPLQNQIGLAGLSRDRVGGRIYFGNSPYLLTQFTYDLSLDKWHLHVFDTLRSDQNLQANQLDFIGGTRFDEEDRDGRYAFRTTITPSTNGVVVNETRDRSAFIDVVNTAGATIDRLLPTVTRLELGVLHSDSFYYGADDKTYLPHSRDVGFVSLTSERETFRFQPFASFRVFRNNDEPWSREVRGGASGPVTENIHFVGSAGYLWEGQTHSARMVANATLRHTIGPYTLQEFRYRRDLTYPELDLENSYTYAIRQVLGPYVYAEAFGEYATFEDLDKNGTGTEEKRAGLHFVISPSSKTTIRVGGAYSKVNYDNASIGHIDRWTAVGQLRQRFGRSWEATFTYQYQTRDALLPTFNYDEDLFVLTVTYYFSNRHRPPAIEGTQPYNTSVIRNEDLY